MTKFHVLYRELVHIRFNDFETRNIYFGAGSDNGRLGAGNAF